jgi:hypothetical protein
MHRTKAFIVGLYGGARDLQDPLIDAGELSALAELHKGSASAFTSTNLGSSN